MKQYKELLFSVFGLSIAIAAWAGATDDHGQRIDKYAQKPSCSAICLFVRYEDNRMILIDKSEVSSEHPAPASAFSLIKDQCALKVPPTGTQETILAKEFSLLGFTDPRGDRQLEFVGRLVEADPINCQPQK